MFKFAILIAASLLLSQATAEPIRLEERQSSIHLSLLSLHRLTYLFSSAVLSSITSDFGDGTSGIVSVATGVASGATSLAGDITSLGDGIVEEVTCPFSNDLHLCARTNSLHSAIGGTAVTLLTSQGGKALTLVTGGAGDVTSIGGHAYTFATGAAASAATGASNAGLTQYDASPIFASMLTLVIGAIAGAFVTL